MILPLNGGKLIINKRGRGNRGHRHSADYHTKEFIVFEQNLMGLDDQRKRPTQKIKPPIEESISGGGKQNDGFILEEEIGEKGDGKFEGAMPKIVVHKCSTGSSKSSGGNDANEGKNGTKEEIEGGRPTIKANGEEEELSGRLRSMKKISELMTISPSAFGHCASKASEPAMMFGMPKLHLETIGGKGRGQIGDKGVAKGGEAKSQTFFQHLARFHNKFGIRHFVLIGLLALYSIFGGLMFEAIERENEVHNLEKTSKILDHSISMLAFKINGTLNVNATFEQHGQLKLLIKQYYLEMLKIEGKYIGSVFHKYETLDMKKVLSWYFASSVFYAMTLFTTIGYGTIACQTPLGKIASIFYAIFGIPLTLVVLSDLGQLMLRFFIFIYERGSEILKDWLRLLALHILNMNKADDVEFPKGNNNNLEGQPSSSSSSSSSECSTMEEEEEEGNKPPIAASEFPLLMSLAIVFVYFLFVSLFITNFDWDENGGGSNGLSFGDSFYFAFISLSTIGLGDVMPNNMQYSPMLAILFLFGLALLSVVNSTIYLRIQGHFLDLVDYLEDYLERINYYRQGHQGYFVFKSLGPSIQLLALALPIFPDEQEDQIGAMLEPENTNLGRRVFPPTFSFPPRNLSRAHSMGTFDSFRPTLGILNAATPPLRKEGGAFGGSSGRMESLRKWENDCPNRRRAATISCLSISPVRGETMAKTLRWEDQQREGNGQQQKRRVQRMYTRRGERLFGSPYLNAAGKMNANLRRVQSERVSTMPSLSTIEELAGTGAERRRHIFESPSPRRMRRTMMRRVDIGRRKTSAGD